MQTLLANKDAIFELKKKVEDKDSSLYDHVAIPNISITEETISIFMTVTKNRRNRNFEYLKYIIIYNLFFIKRA
jgi:hypothetical protein